MEITWLQSSSWDDGQGLAFWFWHPYKLLSSGHPSTTLSVRGLSLFGPPFESRAPLKPYHFRHALSMSSVHNNLIPVSVCQVFISGHFSCIHHADYKNQLYHTQDFMPDLDKRTWFTPTAISSNALAHKCMWPRVLTYTVSVYVRSEWPQVEMKHEHLAIICATVKEWWMISFHVQFDRNIGRPLSMQQ